MLFRELAGSRLDAPGAIAGIPFANPVIQVDGPVFFERRRRRPRRGAATKDPTMLDKSVFTPHGKHLIAGEWVGGETTFTSEPAHGPAHEYSVGTPALVVAHRGRRGVLDLRLHHARAARAFLNAIADEIEARAEAITEIGTQETGLPERASTASAAAPPASCGSSRAISSTAAISTAATTPRCPTASACRAGPEDGPAPHRPGRRLRRLELPAGLLDRGRRHRRGPRRRLPGGGQGPLRPSRHRRDRRRGHPRRHRRHRHAGRGLSSSRAASATSAPRSSSIR